MEWVESIRTAIAYMEHHLLEEITVNDVAENVYMSPFYLQKGFKLMTGYTIGEYIRSRRLYLAAIDVVAGGKKVIDLAYKYGYDTPESFTKAFKRFHGVSPSGMQGDTGKIKVFLPLKITISIQGGTDMDYVVEELKGFKVIGFVREFSYDTAYQEIPKYWDEIYNTYMMPLFSKERPENEIEQTISECMIGMYGISIDENDMQSTFRYMIAGQYTGGKVPEGMSVYEFPDMEWAKFSCVGPMPGSLQSVNTKIFNEWLPGNPEFEIATGVSIEWYSDDKNTKAADYRSEIWIPVKRKKK